MHLRPMAQNAQHDVRRHFLFWKYSQLLTFQAYSSSFIICSVLHTFSVTAFSKNFPKRAKSNSSFMFFFFFFENKCS